MAGLRLQNLHKAFGAVEIIKGERIGAETTISVETASGERALAAIPQDDVFDTGSAVEFRFEPAAAHLFAA